MVGGVATQRHAYSPPPIQGAEVQTERPSCFSQGHSDVSESEDHTVTNMREVYGKAKDESQNLDDKLRTLVTLPNIKLWVQMRF